MEKRYNLRIYPTKGQEEQIKHNLGCVRFVYNYYLNIRMEAHKNGEGIVGLNACSGNLTQLKKEKDYEWLNVADADSLQHAIKQLDLAFKAFFRNVKRKGVAPGYPRFKSKKDTRQTYVSHSHSQRQYVSKKTGELRKYEDSIAIGHKSIKLPKLGWVRSAISKKVFGRILSVTVIKSSSGKYYASMLWTDCENTAWAKTEKIVGLHMGIKTLVATSDGEKICNHRYYEKSQCKIAKLQRKLSRKSSGSKNYEKTRMRLARLYEHAKNQKSDTLHKLTTRFVRQYDVICIRNTDVSTAMRNPRYAKLLADAGWGEFSRYLIYKCQWYGKVFVKIDAFFPSVQLCNACGYRHQVIGRKPFVRQWCCSACGAQHERGINAAINVKNEGLRNFNVRLGKPEVKLVESV